MVSDLKPDLIMTASQRGLNVQLTGNPAVSEGQDLRTPNSFSYGERLGGKLTRHTPLAALA